MEHVVFHPGPDGTPAFRRFPSLEDAVHFVEHLRNMEGVSEVSVHALSPVPLAFRAYYRVEVTSDAEAPAEVAAEEMVAVPAPAEPVLETLAAAPEAVVEPAFTEAAVAAEQPSNGKRSLGFFAH
ncbi:MAG TPA: hypothetical protein VFH54_03600 [Mycobacteriales bacterium]|nr:hypothetical protein [Mycobacteriales bacterium]